MRDFLGYDAQPAQSGISAAGTTLATATVLTNHYNSITGATANPGVALNTAMPIGGSVCVYNRTGVSIIVYPDSSSDQIELNTAGARITLTNGSNASFVRIIATKFLQGTC